MRVCAARSGGGYENPFPGGQFPGSPPSQDALIAAIAARQHGVITTAQLVRAGLTYSGISKRAANGRLHRKYPGVYAVGQPRLSQEGEWIAATLACGPGAYLASLNAAVHMKLWRRRVTGIHVLMPRERRSYRAACTRTRTDASTRAT